MSPESSRQYVVRTCRPGALAGPFLLALGLMAGATRTLPGQDNIRQGLERAEEMLRKGDLSGAERELLSLSRTNPRSYIVHNNLGTLYMQQHEYEAACREFKAAVELNPRVADLQRNLGTCLFQMNELSEALRPLQQALTLDPTDLRARYLLGHSLLLLHRPDEAEPELEFVHSKLPGDEHTLFALVKLYQERHDQEKAAAAFHELQEAHPSSVFVHILTGESDDIQGRTQDAIAEFRQAISLAPEMPRLRFDLGFLLWADNKLDEAAAELREELRVNPTFAPAAYYLGDIALTQNRYPEAARFFEKASSLNPRCLDAYIGLGKTYVRMNQFDEAVAAFQQAGHLDPKQPDVQYWLATVYRRTGQAKKSEAALEQYKELMEKSKRLPAAKQPAHDRWTSATCMN